MVIFEETTPEMACEIIDAARRDLFERNFVNKDTDESIGNVSFSAGVAVRGNRGCWPFAAQRRQVIVSGQGGRAKLCGDVTTRLTPTRRQQLLHQLP
ncbi:MAG: hypothetical protein IPN48_05715 [Sphingomonadales bacterium]|nr:hypothetical protein [Sphingomonadales bacterium]